MPHAYPEIAREEFKILQETGQIYICHPGITFKWDQLLEKCKNDIQRRNDLEQFMQICGEEFVKRHVKDGHFSSKLNNVEF